MDDRTAIDPTHPDPFAASAPPAPTATPDAGAPDDLSVRTEWSMVRVRPKGWWKRG